MACFFVKLLIYDIFVNDGERFLFMEFFKALNLTLFSKKVPAITIASSAVLITAAVMYFFFQKNEYFKISIMSGTGLMIVIFSSFFIYNYIQVDKKKNTVMSFYERWHHLFNAPKLTDNLRKNRKTVNNNMSIEWDKKNKIEKLSFNGYSDEMTPEIVKSIIEDLNKINENEESNDYTFIIKLEEASSDGSLYATRVKKDSQENNIFESRLTVASLLSNIIKSIYGNIPQVQFSESFETGNKGFFNSIMIQGDNALMSPEEKEKVIDELNKKFPNPEGKTWGIQVISSSVFSFKIMDIEEKDSEDTKYYDNFLLRAFKASCKKSGMDLFVEEIDITDKIDNTPKEFSVKIRENDITGVDDQELIPIVKNMIILLKSKYNGSWKASNNLSVDRTIIFKKFD